MLYSIFQKQLSKEKKPISQNIRDPKIELEISQKLDEQGILSGYPDILVGRKNRQILVGEVIDYINLNPGVSVDEAQVF